jgi:hypothetical protein
MGKSKVACIGWGSFVWDGRTLPVMSIGSLTGHFSLSSSPGSPKMEHDLSALRRLSRRRDMLGNVIR